MADVDIEQLKRWRLILGNHSQETLDGYAPGKIALNRDEQIMDDALAAIYDETDPGSSGQAGSPRSAGLGPSSPHLAQWLADIRTFFSQDLVSVIQADAINRKGLTQLFFEPEILKNVQPDIAMVATLLSLRGRIPEKTKDTARELVKAVVAEITRKLGNEIRQAVTGALNKKNHSPIPSAASIDWKYTISRNLKNYNQEYRMLIPERFYFYGRNQQANRWTVILDMDQSGSMADSIIYGSVVGSIFAGLPALNTRIVAFDTEVVDLTDQCANDPVEMLFGIQLGGGTDINKSVAYCQQFVKDPARTMFILLTDLYEGGNQASLIKRLEDLHQSGVKVICLLALSDQGAPVYDESSARKISQLGIPCFACTPGLLPEFIEGALKGGDLMALAKQVGGKRSNRH
ncbi:MAG TPA: VWA domain-containing protein [Bacillota bacterium]